MLQTMSVAATRLPFRYPDGKHNAEALLAEPGSGRLYIITKVSGGASRIYRFPAEQQPDVEVTLEHLGEVTPPADSAPQITAADLHPTDGGALIRTYTHVLYVPAAGSVLDTLQGAPCFVPRQGEPQGEAIAWTSDGRSYLTISEGVSVPVNRIDCGN